MAMLGKDKKLVQKISQLRSLNGESGADELLNMHSRLMKGRTHFESVMTGTLVSAMNISNLDLAVSERVDDLKEISRNLADTANDLNNISSETANITKEVAQAHDFLAQSITEISGDTQECLMAIEKSEENIESIEKISSLAEEDSKKMQEDMSELTSVITQMQAVITSINSISGQTNLLALNASIEAARAGEAGAGFAVVAEEIRQLAEETKVLTNNMATFLGNIQTASKKSVESVETTVASLHQINENLVTIVEGNVENRKRLQAINENLTNIAASSEEISSSMNEVENHAAQLDERVASMNQDSQHLKGVSVHLEKVVKPMVDIEEKLRATNKKIGTMSLDAFYMPSNHVFITNVRNAITAHQKWLEVLDTMIKTGEVQPLQTNDHRCGFGHFYYTMQPKNPEILKVWSSLRDNHKKFHANGGQAVVLVKQGDTGKAREYYNKAEEISRTLLKEFETMISIAERLDKQDIRIFE